MGKWGNGKDNSNFPFFHPFIPLSFSPFYLFDLIGSAE